jgi:hypothetical protein
VETSAPIGNGSALFGAIWLYGLVRMTKTFDYEFYRGAVNKLHETKF